MKKSSTGKDAKTPLVAMPLARVFRVGRATNRPWPSSRQSLVTADQKGKPSRCRLAACPVQRSADLFSLPRVSPKPVITKPAVGNLDDFFHHAPPRPQPPGNHCYDEFHLALMLEQSLTSRHSARQSTMDTIMFSNGVGFGQGFGPRATPSCCILSRRVP